MKLTYKRNVRPGKEPGWLLQMTQQIMEEFGGRNLTTEDYDSVFDALVYISSYLMVMDKKHVKSVISVYRLDENANGKYPIFVARNSTLIQTFYIS